MPVASDFFQSVEIVWGIWILSSLLLALVLWRVLSRLRQIDFLNLMRAEDGSAYVISYVLAFPLFMLLVCAVVQSTIILVVKMGNVYASYATARSAIVWLEAEPQAGSRDQIRRDRIEHAAVNAMAPFGSSSGIHARWLGTDSSLNGSETYFDAYRSYSRGPAPRAYISRKYLCAREQTEILSLSPNQPSEDEPVTVKLQYMMPFHIPWFAKLLGHDRYMPIETEVTLPFEGAHRPPSESGYRRQPSGYPMGIPYYSP